MKRENEAACGKCFGEHAEQIQKEIDAGNTDFFSGGPPTSSGLRCRIRFYTFWPSPNMKIVKIKFSRRLSPDPTMPPKSFQFRSPVIMGKSKGGISKCKPNQNIVRIIILLFSKAERDKDSWCFTMFHLHHPAP